MKAWVLVVLASSFLAGMASGQLVTALDSLTTGGDVTPCADRCAKTIVPATAETPSEVKSCQTGCRLLSIIETVDFDPATGDFTETIKNCNKSCDASFRNENEVATCKMGCSFQVPISKERRNKMSASLEDFFGEHSFPRLSFGFPSAGGDSFFGPRGMLSSSNLGGIFERMQQQMSDMMNNAMSQANDDGMVKEVMPKGGSGRLVIIKSGPGYHSQKTYNFGPDGVKTEVKTAGEEEHEFGNDMLEKANPLEHMLNDADVEVFEPREVPADDKKAKVFSLDLLTPYVRDSNQVSGFDFSNEVDDGPRLPEEGLKSRDATSRRLREEICAQNSESMKWSDWVSCLHMRMGLPRWLTAATLSLGIVFIIWLCLVIPHSAPKQRVKGAKAMEAAGKLEKEHLANLSARPDLFKMDLPPSYEDIANLHVAVPVSTGLLLAEEKKEAEIPKV